MNIDTGSLYERTLHILQSSMGPYTKTAHSILDAVLAEVAKHIAPEKPAYQCLSDRQPYETDSTDGYVLAYYIPDKVWYAVKVSPNGFHGAGYTHWMPMPPPPISEDDHAFGCVLRDDPPANVGVDSHTFHNIDVRALRHVWDAALAHRDKSKP